MLVPYEIPILITSDNSLNNVTVTNEGSQALVQLKEVIKIPKEALNVTVELEQALIYNNNPNIKVNTIMIINTQNLNIDIGLYEIDTLNKIISDFIYYNGISTAGDKFYFESNEVNSFLTLIFDNPTVNLSVQLGPEVASLLGFADILYSNTASPVRSKFSSSSPAQVNQTEFLLCHVPSLIPNGILINNQYSSVIAQLALTAPPQSQIIYETTAPCQLSTNLAGTTINQISVYWTDNKLFPLNTMGEKWTVRLSINYLNPEIIKDSKGNLVM
jgi:hypothetical protein